MRKNYKVSGVISLWVNDALHSVLEYETLHQRCAIIEKFENDIKHIRQRAIIYYVISIDENSLPTHGKKKVRIPKATRLHNKNKNGIYVP